MPSACAKNLYIGTSGRRTLKRYRDFNKTRSIELGRSVTHAPVVTRRVRPDARELPFRKSFAAKYFDNFFLFNQHPCDLIKGKKISLSLSLSPINKPIKQWVLPIRFAGPTMNAHVERRFSLREYHEAAMTACIIREQ